LTATTSAFDVGAVRRALEALGVDPSKLTRHARGPVVPGATADALVDRAALELDDDALGLTLVARVPIGSLGVIDYGMCTSSTLREALQLVARYYGVLPAALIHSQPSSSGSVMLASAPISSRARTASTLPT